MGKMALATWFLTASEWGIKPKSLSILYWIKNLQYINIIEFYIAKEMNKL